MQADTVLVNGNIRTQYDAQPQVRALAIRAGRILALGEDDDMRALLGTGGEVVDLGGALVIPGLVDAHVHLSWYAHFLHNVDLTEARSAQHAAELVAERARSAAPGTWIEGRGWSQDRWPDRAFPTAAQLDAVVPDHPVYLEAQSAHAAWVNLAALRQAGITAETPDPPGGRIGRDASGQPTGVLFESAMGLVKDRMPEPDAAQMAEHVRTAITRAQRGGLTGVHDFDGAVAFQAYQLLQEQGALNFRIVKNLPVELLDHAISLGLRWGFGDDFLRIGGVKMFADGALGPRTAWMVEPYEGEPENTGICTMDPEEMMACVSRASAAGLPSTIHAIGDLAVHHVLNVYEAVRKEEAARGVAPDRRRHRIEHVQLIHPDDTGRLGALGIIASMQPNHATSDMEMADRYWGERAGYAYNWRLQLDAGARLALGSDAPIEPIEPLPNIQAAVTRRRADGSPGPEGWRSGHDGRGRLTVDEAVRGFTLGPAYAAGLEDRLGRLAPGYLADLVVLGQDIYTCDPMAIGETPVLGTMIGGRWVHRNLP
ncbi:MAG TPA: amidohydrolase [Aggregatilineales bacterium]|nr:amidohydrolase [Aggregatilineales bacterium]HQA69260.1 amidohydrolase [Aggregatilineales bacterium]